MKNFLYGFISCGIFSIVFIITYNKIINFFDKYSITVGIFKDNSYIKISTKICKKCHVYPIKIYYRDQWIHRCPICGKESDGQDKIESSILNWNENNG